MGSVSVRHSGVAKGWRLDGMKMRESISDEACGMLVFAATRAEPLQTTGRPTGLCGGHTC